MIQRAEALAVVGMACRFPGGLESIQKLWEGLKSGYSAIAGVPEDRWSAEKYFSSSEVSRGKTYIRRGGFLHQNFKAFDAAFFGISPRDAENMDPQQRLLLEVVWEAFENAGLSLPAHSRRQVGVYVGGFMLDHMITQMAQTNRSQINAQTAAGMMMTMLSNRISHTFDFRGPSLSIDTACSSSLVAFHYACQDLWRGACELAVVGGSNVMTRPEYPIGMCKGHFLSRDGECKSFDARGDGYGRGEGAGIVLVKPLARALADGDQVLATVLATGTNQDGHTPGISMPNGEAQQALIEQVCRENGIDPGKVRYVECHGTGTAIGDPTEAGAIGRTYGANRNGNDRVVIGSIKSNIGHLEAGAGVAGIIKAVLTLQNRTATRLANLQQPHPEIPFDQLGLQLSDREITLAGPGETFCAAINSFGYGGSNAHAILQTAPVVTEEPATAGTQSSRTEVFPGTRFLPLSARSDAALSELALRYRELLESGADLDDVLHSASMKRAHLSHRGIVSGSNRAELMEALQALATGTEHPGAARGTEPFQGSRLPVLVYTGMGPQWWGMGQELYRESPLFRSTLEQADAIFRKISGFSILDEMLKPEAESRITQTRFAQPANLLLQIGLTVLLQAAGIRAGAIVGHSVGELASAWAAGVLTMEQALTVCFHRSRLQAEAAGTGGMLAAGVSKQQALELIDFCKDKVSIAAVNGPANVTLAGDRDCLATIAEKLTAAGQFNRALEVEVPYHSPMMDPLMEPLATALAGINPELPTLPLYSTVSGTRVEDIQYGAQYWPQNIRQPVEFSDAIQSLLRDGYSIFLEVGPHPVLSSALRDCIRAAGKDCRNVATLRRNSPETDLLRRALMNTYVAGADLDWAIHNGNGRWIELPNYPWQREVYWLENPRAMQDRISAITHPILGTQEAPGVPAWRNDFDYESMSYLRDHVVSGLPILPAAGYIEALLEMASIQFPEAPGLALRNLIIQAPLILAADRGLDFVTSLDTATRQATIRSLENGRLGTGQIHMTGKLAALPLAVPGQMDLALLQAGFHDQEDITTFYRNLRQQGLAYGPAFQTVRELWIDRARGASLARVELGENQTGHTDLYRLHPSLLDGCFQTLIAILESPDFTYLPTGFGEICLLTNRMPDRIWCLGQRTRQSGRTVDCDLTLLDDSGTVVAVVRGMQATAANRRERYDQFGDRVKLQVLGYQWSQGEPLQEPKRLGHWLVAGSDADQTEWLCQRLEHYGATVSARVGCGSEFEQNGSKFVVRRGVREDLEAVLAACGDLDGVVCLGPTEVDPLVDPTGEAELLGLVQFTQALIARKLDPAPRVYVVTRSAFRLAAGDQTTRPDQATFNGFARVAFNELEGFRFSSIDLPAQTDEESLDGLALELLCDAAEDEVALRGGLRLVSELSEIPVLAEDRWVYRLPDDNHPVCVRPLKGNSDVGTARIEEIRLGEPAPDEIVLRVEASAVPLELLRDNSGLAPSRPWVGMVGVVTAVGAKVTDLSCGMRVAGLAPAEVASHLKGRREDFHVVPVGADTPASTLAGSIELAVRAERAVAQLELAADDRALVQLSPLGMEIATLLRRRGIPVTLTSANPEVVEQERQRGNPVCHESPTGLEQYLQHETKGRPFTILVAGMARWMESLDLRWLANGGTAIDTDEAATPIDWPQHLGGLIRTDLNVQLQRPSRFAVALTSSATRIARGESVNPAILEVSIADIAWEKLPLADTRAALVLTLETTGRDLPVAQRDHLAFDANATWLVTGGFGGFGQRTARWLVEHGARHLVLTGRTGADTPARKEFVASLESLGAVVQPVACDTADMEQLQNLFREIEQRLPPLKGVFHSAAIIEDQPVLEIDPRTLSRVMQSKALGAWNLHQLTCGMELEHFVLFSSAANLVGNSRQAIYSSANGFLDGLAQMRRSLGMKATSVNWGAISDVGVVAKDEKLEQFLRYVGLRGIPSTEALDLLYHALARDITQFGVTLITSWADWGRFETRGALSPRFTRLIQADSGAKDTAARDALVAELAGLSPEDRTELLSELIREILAGVLKADPARISLDRPINELGVDSLMGTEIQLLLDSKLGLTVSVLELIGDSTVRTIAVNCLKTLDLNPAAVAAVRSAEPATSATS